MKSILVPTDLSSNAQNAINYATKVARYYNAKITLLHTFQIPVMDTSVPTFMVQSMIEEEEERCEQELSKIAEEISNQTYSGSDEPVNCEYLVKQGFAVEEIIYYSEEKKADLIIMGTQGASGLKRIILGSNTSYIIERTSIPVIAVPEKAKVHKIDKMVYATQLQEGDEKTMHKVVDFAKHFYSHVTVLHIGSKDDKDIEKRLSDFKEKVKDVTDWPHIAYEVFSHDSVPDGLSEYLEQNEIDLLAMVTRKRNLFQELFNPSMTKNMAFHAKVPLLAYQYEG